MIRGYKIVRSSEKEIFEEILLRYLRDGWKLSGPLVMETYNTTSYYNQPILMGD